MAIATVCRGRMPFRFYGLFTARGHGCHVDEFEDMDVPFTLLPGVDLALWARLAVVLMTVMASTVMILLIA